MNKKDLTEADIRTKLMYRSLTAQMATDLLNTIVPARLHPQNVTWRSKISRQQTNCGHDTAG